MRRIDRRRTTKDGIQRRRIAPLVFALLTQIGAGAMVGGLAPIAVRAQGESHASADVMAEGTLQAQTPEPTPAFRLVSAQVVTSTGNRPPLLRLAANGPIAFRVLTAAEAAESGVPLDSGRLMVRLHGVRPGDLTASGNLAPFSIVITPANDDAGGASDSIVNVGLAALPAGASLRARSGQRINELEFVVTP
jgi:hypothetical protein